MRKFEIERKAVALQKQVGGKIFVFPINETDPFSEYVIAIDVGNGQFKAYDDNLTINDAAACLKELLDTMKSEGLHVEYSKDVRFVSYEAQMNAPDVTMRRLKKENVHVPIVEHNSDVMENPEDPEQMLISVRGLIKIALIEMLERNPMGIQFMNEYFKILATQRYGKTASAIRHKVSRMSKAEAIRWAEETYDRYVSGHEAISKRIMGFMGGIKN